MARTVSAVITTFNQDAYIGEAVESALTQTLPPCEVIVIDDGSTDGTPATLRHFGQRITYIAQANSGIPQARTRGVRASSGALVAFLDGDDRWHPEKLRRQVDAFERFPEAGLVACDGQQIGDGGVMLPSLFGPRVPRPNDPGDPVTCGDCFEEFLGGSLVSSTSQAVIPRAVLDQVGDADAAFPFASLFDIFLRIAARHPVTFVREVLMDWRYLESSASGPLEMRPFRWGEDTVAILSKHLRSSTAERRPAIRRARTERSRQLARSAFYRADGANRRWGLSYLWRLWMKSGRDPTVALYLAGLLVPPQVRSLLPAGVRPRATADP
jgi:glycosyltransferase involved in cell wall biosynthesis